MRLLDARSPLPHAPRRVAVAGPSGAGKSRIASIVADILDVPYVEFDSLYHGPEWTVRETWQREVLEFVAGPAWAIEWQGEEVREPVTARTDLLVWLDHPRWLTVAQVVERTVRRRRAGGALWNGNTERPLWRVLTDRDHILRWAWRAHPMMRERMHRFLRDGGFPDLVVVRLRGRREVESWLAGPLLAGALLD